MTNLNKYSTELLEKNNIIPIMVGTGVTFFEQTIGDLKLYLSWNGPTRGISYTDTKGGYFSKYNNKKYILDKFNIKPGERPVLIKQ